MIEWVAGVVEQTGYIGVLLLMFLENLFPPIPSELIMPLAGFAAARGELHVLGVLLAGVTGSLAGALFWYYVGRWVGSERLKLWAAQYGRWFTLAPEEVDQATAWFRRHCHLAVLFGRLVPAVRTLISVPAGIAGMDLPKFLLYSGLGTVVWTGFLIAGGYLLEERYEEIQSWLNPVSNTLIVVLIAWYLYRVATFRPQAKQAR